MYRFLAISVFVSCFSTELIAFKPLLSNIYEIDQIRNIALSAYRTESEKILPYRHHGLDILIIAPGYVREEVSPTALSSLIDASRSGQEIILASYREDTEATVDLIIAAEGDHNVTFDTNQVKLITFSPVSIDEERAGEVQRICGSVNILHFSYSSEKKVNYGMQAYARFGENFWKIFQPCSLMGIASNLLIAGASAFVLSLNSSMQQITSSRDSLTCKEPGSEPAFSYYARESERGTMIIDRIATTIVTCMGIVGYKLYTLLSADECDFAYEV